MRERPRPNRRPLFPWTTGPLREGRAAPKTLQREAAYRRFLALGDLVGTYAAIVLGGALTDHRPSLTALVAAPLVVVLAKGLGLYDRDQLLVHKTTLDETPELFRVATVFTLGSWIAHDAIESGAFSTPGAAVLWALLLAMLVACRTAARWTACKLTEPERCIVVGNAAAADSLRRSFERGASVNAEVVGRVPIQYGRRHGEDPPGVVVPSGVPFLGDLDALGEIIARHEIDRVLIAPGAGLTDELLNVIRAVKAFGARVSVVPRLFEVVGSSAAFDDVEGTTLLGIRQYGLSRSSWLLKRAVDITVAAAVLVVLAPVLLLTALAIKLDSPGPVLFRQRRIGEKGREFEMLKFRTMTEDAEHLKDDLAPLNESDGLFKIADDPRITGVGKLLRRASLDEIPQLINVLRGEMSLVGPRPLVPDDDLRVRGWDRRRLHVPPGMTGHWQILGSSRVPLGEMVKIDYLYGANWSLWGDMKILLRTVPYVLARRGQ